MGIFEAFWICIISSNINLFFLKRDYIYLMYTALALHKNYNTFKTAPDFLQKLTYYLVCWYKKIFFTRAGQTQNRITTTKEDNEQPRRLQKKILKRNFKNSNCGIHLSNILGSFFVYLWASPCYLTRERKKNNQETFKKIRILDSQFRGTKIKIY